MNAAALPVDAGIPVVLVWLLVGLGLAVVTLQRRTFALGAVTLQALAVVAVALGNAGSGEEFVAAVALGARALGLAVIFLVLIARTRDPRPVAVTAPLRRGGLAAALALGLGWLVPSMGLAARSTERVVLALVAFGLLVVATRAETVFQVLGLILVENALALAALALPGTSWLIELGAAFDLTLIALVAGVFHERIFAEFGAGDSGLLVTLKD
jgi:hydrogenase-4 membrane subunit HyfE